MKKFLVMILALTLAGCINLDFFPDEKEKNIKNEYSKLSIRLDRLMENEINERNRIKLEEDFIKYKNKIATFEMKDKKNSAMIEEYMKKADIKIQYLKDLKD